MNHKLLSIAALCATLAACNSNNSNQILDGWVVKNEVKNIESIDLEEIADIIDVKPIVGDEPIGQISAINGNSNDFIGSSGGLGETFYHIKDGKLVEKLHAKGNGPNEYLRFLVFSYLPSDNLIYGYDDAKGQIMCYQTSPFKFVSKFETKNHLFCLFTAGGNQVLFTARPPVDECKDVETQELPNGAKISKIKDSSTVYSFDGLSLTKLLSIVKPGDSFSPSVFTRTDNGVLMALQMPKYTIYRYTDSQVEKVVTIDYGEMEMPEPKMKIETQGEMTYIRAVIDDDYSTDCNYPQLIGSTLTYWHRTVLQGNTYNCLAIATPDNVHNYTIGIGGLLMSVTPDMVDNGVYTMLIQGDWEGKINYTEELSPLGKRIIETMKQSDDNPVYLQFRLKDKYLMND